MCFSTGNCYFYIEWSCQNRNDGKYAIESMQPNFHVNNSRLYERWTRMLTSVHVQRQVYLLKERKRSAISYYPTMRHQKRE